MTGANSFISEQKILIKLGIVGNDDAHNYTL